MIITRMSMLTGVTRSIDLPVTHEQLTAWCNGCLAQDAFPQLSPSDREFIMSGVTDDEWSAFMSEEDDEDED